MAIITFTSDFGTRDHYVATVKAKIFNYNPTIQVIDIAHHIEHNNIAHAAFVLNAVYRDFPKGTVHILAVNTLSAEEDKFIAVKVEDHFFVTTDNGIMGLLSDKTPVSVELLYDKNTPHTFPEKNVFAFAAVSLASGKNIYDLGQVIQPAQLKKIFNRKLKTTKNTIEGHVLHVDNYGNALTNIKKSVFEEVRANRSFMLTFSRQRFEHIQQNYYAAEDGDCVIVFNDLGVLEIAIKNGNASQLLGLQYDSVVRVEFSPEL